MKGINVLWRDVVFLLLMLVIGVAMLQLPHLNPVTKELEDEIKTQGELVITIGWRNAVDIDVDLWVKTATKNIISYRRKHQRDGDLLRDDLGTGYGQGDSNFEMVLVRKINPGKYVVNVHLFGLGRETNAQYLPLTVETKVAIYKEGGNVAVFSGEVELRKAKQEKTSVSFMIDHDGKLVPESISSLPVRLVYEEEE